MNKYSLGPVDIGFLSLITVAIISMMTDDRFWSILAGAAALATLAAVVVHRLMAPPMPTKTSDAAPSTGQVLAQVQDIIDAYKLAGFEDGEAREMVRDQMRAQAQTEPAKLYDLGKRQ